MDDYGVQINYQNNRNARCAHKKHDPAETEALLPGSNMFPVCLSICACLTKEI